MRRIFVRALVASAVALLAIGIAATMALAGRGGTAANPSFQYANSSLSSNGQVLSVSFKEVGLGSQYTIDSITLSADVTSEWGCFTKSGNLPAATNHQGPSTLFNTQSFQVLNGQVTNTISLSIVSKLTCNNGQRLRLISASYSNITVSGAGASLVATPSTQVYP